MKKVLYYALARPSFYARDKYDVLAVTSEGPRGRINGRWPDDAPTHTNARNVVAKFDTAEKANGYVTRAEEIGKAFDAKRQPHQDAMSVLYNEERQALSALEAEARASK